MHKTRKFFNDVVFYSSSNFLSNILNFITGIVVRRVLQPSLMGLFNEIMLIFDYAKYSHLGIIDALDRELPYLYGKKDYKKLESTKDTGFTVCLITALFAIICLFLASIFIKFNNNRLLINGVRIVCFLVLIQLVNSIYIVLNRSRNRFSVISRYTILVAVLDVVLKIFLVIKFGLYGILSASILTAGLGLIYFYKATSETFRIILNFPLIEVARLFKIGFPIFIMGFVGTTLKNIDRIMIIRLLDKENLGFYTIALMGSVYIVQLPNLIYAVIFPRFYQAYGEKQNIFEIKELFIKPMLIFAYIFPILVGLVILGLPLLVHHILPLYVPGLIPAYILLLGSSFSALVNMPGYLMIVLNKQIHMIFIGIVAIILGVSLNYLFVRNLGLGLSGIAIGTTLANLFYATILMAYAFRHYTKSFFSQLKFFVELYLPFLWMIVLLFVLQAFTFKSQGTFLKDFPIIFCKALVYFLCCVPLILYANRKTSILTLLKKSYLEKKMKQ